MQDIDVREQLGEQLAAADGVTVVPGGDKVCERLLSVSIGADSVSSLRTPSSRSRSARYFSAVHWWQMTPLGVTNDAFGVTR